MDYRNILYVCILSIFFVFGCAPTQNIKVEKESVGTFPVHGQFCGPEVPLIQETDINLHVQKLEDIQPIDQVDAMCKKHDICYARKGYFNKECDRALITEIEVYRKKAKKRCLGLALLISTNIKANSSFSRFDFTDRWIDDLEKVDNPISAVLIMPFGAISIAADIFWNTVDLASAGIVGVGSIYNGAVTSVIDPIVAVTPSKKDPRLDYFLPGRFEKCD